MAALCTRTAGYDLSNPGLYGDVPAAPPQPTPADRDRAELLARYGAPVSLNPLPREHLPGDVSEWVREEAFERARADAARRRHLL